MPIQEEPESRRAAVRRCRPAACRLVDHFNLATDRLPAPPSDALGQQVVMGCFGLPCREHREHGFGRTVKSRSRSQKREAEPAGLASCIATIYINTTPTTSPILVLSLAYKTYTTTNTPTDTGHVHIATCTTYAPPKKPPNKPHLPLLTNC
eukprot:scaffold7578_cov121-Isochrysis_galbana.AAC.3